jgi:hypothetical protein
MLKPMTIFNAVLLIGLSCLGLAVTISIVHAFVPLIEAQGLISTLSDGFKLCLGAILALLNDRTMQKNR